MKQVPSKTERDILLIWLLRSYYFNDFMLFEVEYFENLPTWVSSGLLTGVDGGAGLAEWRGAPGLRKAIFSY
jgi:hypothetical protein